MEHAPKYEKHIFVCVNERPEGNPRPSCGGADLRLGFVQLISKHGLKGKIRANKSLCLDACEMGPTVAIYPQGIWYTNVKPEDVEEIFDSSILKDEIVTRLVATAETWQQLKKIRDQEKK